MAESITQQALASAIQKLVAQSSGESIGLKTLRRDLETEFRLAKRSLDSRKDEIKELLLAAMNQAEQEQDQPGERGRARTGGSVGAPRPAAETVMPWEEEPEIAKGKERAGQAADFEGFLKKRGDQGRIKLWSKRYFKLYKTEGVIAYFKSDKETKQLGEISVVGAFLIEKRDDIAKLAFTITMKTTARIWWLQAKDEAQRQSWIDACSPLMKEEVGGVEKKRRKPPLGEPLRFPPTYVQGWSEIEDSKSVIQESKNWTGLLPKAGPQVELADGLVAISIDGSSATVEEVRHVKIDANKQGFIHNLPRQLEHATDSVQWSAKDSQLTQARFFYDNRTQEELLKRLVGHEIEVTNRRKDAFGEQSKFKGKVAYHSEDRVKGERRDLDAKDGHQFALVDETANTVHFLNTKDAHSFNLLAVDRKKLSPGSDDVFAEPRLWAHFHTEAAQSLGQLVYSLADAVDVQVNFNLTLNPNETAGDLQGFFDIENKTSRTFQGATLSIVPGPPKKSAGGKLGEAVKDVVDQVTDAAVDGAKDAAASKVPKGFGALAALAGGLLGAPKADPPPPRKYRYHLAEKVTLPAYDVAHASFVHQQVSTRSQHLVRFDEPKYTIKPITGQETGTDAAAQVNTVVSFQNPLSTPLPAGSVRINRRAATHHGAIQLATVQSPRVEAGEWVYLDLEKLHGVTVTRKQTGYNFDAEKRFIIESFEITVANGRQELVHIDVEESMYRWSHWEITSSWPKFKPTKHPRKIRFQADLNHGEDITIRYTVFYSSFELDDWEEDGNADAAADPAAAKK